MWEYLIVIINDDDMTYRTTSSESWRPLIELGQNNWQLVGIKPYRHDGQTVGFFKRPVSVERS